MTPGRLEHSTNGLEGHCALEDLVTKLCYNCAMNLSINVYLCLGISNSKINFVKFYFSISATGFSGAFIDKRFNVSVSIRFCCSILNGCPRVMPRIKEVTVDRGGNTL